MPLDLSVQLAPKHKSGLLLPNPVMTASGTFGYGMEYSHVFDIQKLGAIVCKGTTLDPREGNPQPRLFETASGLLNSIGLQNIGVKALIREKTPTWASWQVPVIVNIAGDTVDDYAQLAGKLDGVAGISGTLMMIFAIGAMMVANRPDEFPMPISDFDWKIFEQDMYGLLGGFTGFLIGAYFIGRYLPNIPVANRLILTSPQEPVEIRSGGQAAPAPPPPVKIGQEGISLSPLRPSGIAKFGNERVNVVSTGQMIDIKQKIKVVAIEGNSIVVKEVR